VQFAREGQTGNGFFPNRSAAGDSRGQKVTIESACPTPQPSANNLIAGRIAKRFRSLYFGLIGHFLMKTKHLLGSLLLCAGFAAATLHAGTPAQEKAFTEKYKAAYEAKDTATLESFLYTKGANPMALEFYKMMMSEGAGGKLAKIELANLTPEEAKKAAGTQDGPGGAKTKMPITPTKKLKLTVETKDANGTSSSTNECLVAEKDGKFVIPVPVDVK